MSKVFGEEEHDFHLFWWLDFQGPTVGGEEDIFKFMEIDFDGYHTLLEISKQSWPTYYSVRVLDRIMKAPYGTVR